MRALAMAAVLGAVLYTMSGAALAQPGPSQAELSAAADNTADWLHATHDYAGQRFVRLDQINARNASELRPVCIHQLATVETFQSNGLVHDGVLYVTTPKKLVAIDATNCAPLWSHTIEPRREGGIASQRGMAIKDGLIVRGTQDGHLLALHARTGEVAWDRLITDPDSGDSVNGAPLIFEDMVIAGPAGTYNGFVAAFDLATGEPRWRFNTMPQPGEPFRDTWGSEETLASGEIGGGSVWTLMTLDAEAGLLYVPVGNANPAFYGDDRPGDNLFTNSVLVLDVRTGERQWHYQMAPHDVHNWDTSQAGPLFTATIDGVERRLVAATGKIGELFLIDRDTQDVVHRLPVTSMKNAGAALTREGIHMCPGYFGGVLWNGPAYSPDTGLLYVPSIDWCSEFYENADEPRGGGYRMDPLDKANGWITAVDPITGTVRWRYQAGTPMLAAVTATSGGVVFTGDLDGQFLVLDARNGDRLYSFATGGSMMGGVLSYQIGGRQFVAALAGSQSALYGAHGSPSVVLFALD